MMRRNLPGVLACTGGIGSGKTFFATIFEHLGVPVYYSDIRAKELYFKNLTLVNDIISLLGKDIVEDSNYNPDNSVSFIPRLNFKKMASLIFNDTTLRNQLEDLVHPAVLRDFMEWREVFVGKKEYVIIESAIILEKPIFRSLDKKVMTIISPMDIRIERVMKRDSATRNDVIERIESQWSDEQRTKMADFVIFADEKQPLLGQVLKVHSSMLELYKCKK